MHILHVVGARPNFMKAAPVVAALQEHGVRQTIVHTGQHYDAFMSDVFFQQLGIPEPDVNAVRRSLVCRPPPFRRPPQVAVPLEVLEARQS